MLGNSNYKPPSLTIGFIMHHPFFSSLKLIPGLFLHIFGNFFFASVAIFYAFLEEIL